MLTGICTQSCQIHCLGTAQKPHCGASDLHTDLFSAVLPGAYTQSCQTHVVGTGQCLGNSDPPTDCLSELLPGGYKQSCQTHLLGAGQVPFCSESDVLTYLLRAVLRYLCTELSGPSLRDRASAILGRFGLADRLVVSTVDRYLYTELSDPSFGDRASAILGRFREGNPNSEAMAAVALQGQMMAQLSYIVDQLKVS